MIIVYGLQLLIDGSTLILSRLLKKQITTKNGEIQEIFEDNSEYHVWDRQYNALKNWIYSLVSPNCLKHLIEKTIGFDYWMILGKVF